MIGRNSFLTVLEAGNPKVKALANSMSGESPFGHRQSSVCPRVVGEARKLVQALLWKTALWNPLEGSALVT